MVRFGDAFQGLVQGLAAFGQGMEMLRRQRGKEQLEAAQLLGKEGEITPLSGEELAQTLTQQGVLGRFFGGRLPAGVFNIGDQYVRATPARRYTAEQLVPFGVFNTEEQNVPLRGTIPEALGMTRPELVKVPVKGLPPGGITLSSPTATLLREQSKERRLTVRELLKEKRQEDADFQKQKITLFQSFQDKGLNIPLALKQQFLAAKTPQDLLEVLPQIPPEQQLEITVDGKTYLRPAKEVLGYLTSQDRDRRFQLAQENSQRAWMTAFTNMLDKQRMREQFERGPISAEEAAARRRLGKPMTGILPSEEHAEVGEEVLRFRTEGARRTTTAQQEAKEPYKELADERRIRLQQQLAKIPRMSLQRDALQALNELRSGQPITNPIFTELYEDELQELTKAQDPASVLLRSVTRQAEERAGKPQVTVGERATQRSEAVKQIQEAVGRLGSAAAVDAWLKKMPKPKTPEEAFYLKEFQRYSKELYRK